MKKKILLGAAIVLAVGALVAAGIFVVNRIRNEEEVNVSWYDENKTEFSISTVDQLYELAQLSRKTDLTGKTFKLEKDLVVNEGSAEDWVNDASARKWYPIQNFSGTFDGQGHTISGLYANIYDQSMGFFTDTQAGAVIRDFRLENTYFKVSGSPGTATIAGGAKNRGTFEKIYTDAVIDCDGNFTGGIVSTATGELTLSECWFDGSITRYYYNITGGGLIAQVDSSVITVEHCLNTGKIVGDEAKSYARVGGICGLVAGSGNLIVNDSLSTGTIETKTKTQVGSVVGFIGTSSMATLRTVFTTNESFGAIIGNGEERVRGGVIRYDEKYLVGDSGYRYTNLDFDNYWAISKESTPKLKYFSDENNSTEGLEKVYDISWYTGDKAEYILYNEKELYGFSILSAPEDFTGITVKLGADITVNEGKATSWAKNEPEKFWIPISNFGGVFDGQGHTISGIYLKGSGTMGLFHKTALGSVVKNLRLTNSYYENTGTATAYTGSIAGICGGELNTIYSDAIMTSTGVGVGGMAGGLTVGIPKITNCWYDGRISLLEETGFTAGGMAGVVQVASTIEHSLNTSKITAERTTNYTRVGGMAGVVGSSSILSIKDCLNAGTMDCYEKQAGAILGFIGTESSATLDTVCNTLDSYPATIGQGSERVKGLPVQYERVDLLGYGGYQWTNLDFKNYWAAVNNSIPILKSFAPSALRTAGVEKKFDTSWYNSSKKTFTLTDAKDLYGLAILSGTGETFSGKTVQLGADIVVNAGSASTWKSAPPSDKWIPVSDFAGTFDGQGHSISGLYKKGSTNIGLFGSTGEKAVIKNLIVENSYFANTTATGDVNIGGIVAQGGGTFDTIYSDVIIECSGVGVGGIVASMSKGTAKVNNCWFAGSIQMLGEDGFTAGGIVGTVKKNTTLENCLNSGTIRAERTSNYTRLGGLVALISGANVTFKDCLSVGEITSIKKQAGTILGFFGATAKVNFKANVYSAKESFTATVGAGTGTKTGTITSLTTSRLYGERAKKNASGLNYKKYWTTLTKRTPILTSFASKAPALVNKGMTPDTSWYNASKKEFILTTPEQLYGLAELSYDRDFAGVVIKLGNDIKVNDGEAANWRTSAPKYEWDPIQSFAGTFNGQGYTISGLYITGGKTAGLFAEATASSVIKNFKLTNSYFANTSSTGEVNLGGIVGQGGGKLDTIYTDAIIETTGNTIGGIIGSVNVVSNKNSITNCWFAGKLILKGANAHTAGGIVGTVGTADDQGSLIVKNCLVNNESDEAQIVSTGRTGYLRIGGICGIVRNGSSKLTVGSDLVVIKISSGTTNNTGSVVGYMVTNLTYADDVYVLSSYSKQIGNKSANAKVDETNGKLRKIANKGTILGRNAITAAPKLDFENYWVPIQDETPVLKSFKGDKIALEEPKTDWYDPDGKEFTLTTVEQLYEFTELSVYHDFAGQTFYLGGDITVNELGVGESAKDWLTSAPAKVWNPIGSAIPFAGTFNGKGFAIKGLYVNDATNAGLFANTTENSTIIDVKVLDSCFVNTSSTGEVNIGSIVGQGGGRLEKIYTNAIVKTSGNTIGGLIGSVNIVSDKNIITNCWFAGQLILEGSQAHTAGGIVGTVGTADEQGTLTIDNCLVNNESDEAQIVSTGRTGYLRIGGICGIVRNGSSKLTIGSDLVVIKIDSETTNNAGSIIGYLTTNLVYANDVYVLSNYAKQIGNTGGSAKTDTTRGKLQIVTSRDTILGWNATSTADKLDFVNYWVPIQDQTPALKYFQGDRVAAEKPQVEEGWYDPAGKEFTITTADQLYELAELSKTYDFAGQTFYLGNDITVNELKAGGSAKDWLTSAPEKKWTPIGSTKPFAGTFDGKGFAIKGLYVNGKAKAGLFAATTADSTIKDVKVLDSCFVYMGTTAEVNIGSIVGQGGGRLEKVYTNAIVKTSGNTIGGLIGSVNIVSDKNIVTNCWFAGQLILEGAQAHTAGGIVGTVGTADEQGTLIIDNCLVNNESDEAQIISSGRTASNAYLRIGGICGIVRNGSSKLTLASDLVVIKIESPTTNNAGSIIGYLTTNLVYANDVYVLSDYAKQIGNTGGSAETDTTNGKLQVIDSKDAILGWKATKTASTLDYKNYWVPIQDQTPVLTYFKGDMTVAQDPDEEKKLSMEAEETFLEKAAQTAVSPLVNLWNKTVRKVSVLIK